MFFFRKAAFIAIGLAGLAACSDDDEPAPSTAKQTSATDGTKSDGTSQSTGSSLGPECTAYVACCKDLAAKQPQASASCDSVKTQIDEAQKKGVATSTYEASCKQGVASFKSAGYCD